MGWSRAADDPPVVDGGLVPATVVPALLAGAALGLAHGLSGGRTAGRHRGRRAVFALARTWLWNEAAEMDRMYDAVAKGALSQLSVRGLGDFVRKKDRVEVITLTWSRGLEFDVVLIARMDEESVPHYLSLGDPEKVAEDRRKFYVSLTRARDEVRIFYSGFVVTKWGRRKGAGPSRFLVEVGLV